MALRTKCIRHPKEASDGLRVSIMSRHTLNDGVTPDESITPDMFDEHWVEFAPPPRLIGDYYKRGLEWSGFEMRYAEYLAAMLDRVRDLIQMAKVHDVTVLCTEDEPTACHRRLLAEFCHRLDPDLEIDVR